MGFHMGLMWHSLGSMLRLAGGCVMLQSHAFSRYMGPMPPLWQVWSTKLRVDPCEAVYIGETGRTLQKRVTEHKYAVQRHDVKNGIAVHAWIHTEYVVEKGRGWGEEEERRRVSEPCPQAFLRREPGDEARVGEDEEKEKHSAVCL